MGTKIILVFLVVIIILLLSYKKILFWIERHNEQKEIAFKKRTGLDLWSLNRLSAEAPFFWGLEKFLFDKRVFYFDDTNLYLIKPNEPLLKYPLSTITEVTRTMITINKRRVWQIIIDNSGQRLTYKLRTYSNLGLFLEKVKENPNAIVDDQYIWGIFE
ncbi:hypothetical protein ACFSJW_04780 [Flavobacterium artemisiae]|uniref:Uncharacterized protein n=1 Tax=Flavobacterium artemisiae TaxID=2126556 RepID=A0ABW4HKL7_9FLAO